MNDQSSDVATPHRNSPLSTVRLTRQARHLLILLFLTMFCLMLLMTIRASMVRSVFDNGNLLQDVWFQATLADAFFGFITFFVWVAYREPTWLRRGVWFILIMLFGNLAMSAYAIDQLRRYVPPDEPSL